MFRKLLQDKIDRATTLMKKLQLDLQEYKDMTIPYDKEVNRLLIF
jgi:hypothetical protein